MSPQFRSVYRPLENFGLYCAAGRIKPLCSALLVATAVGALLGSGGLLTLYGFSAYGRPADLTGDVTLSPSFRGWGGADQLPLAGAHVDVDMLTDDDVSSHRANKHGPVWMAPPIAEVRLRDDAQARQRYWYECLDSVDALDCRPSPELPQAPLPFHSWRKHVVDLILYTARFRSIPFHVYRHPDFNTSSYSGPWIENKWIHHFLGESAWESFYPLVPLFVQWTDALHNLSNSSIYDEAVHAIFGPESPLRADVVYVTVMQLDRVPASQIISCSKLRNVVVLGANGWGNVAIPLLKGETLPMNHNIWPRDKDPVHNWARKSVFNVIVDSAKHGRYSIASIMSSSLLKEDFKFWPFDTWQWVTHSAIFVGSMWGADRSSFRLYENVRYGRVCLHIYKDYPWLPYQHAFDFKPPDTVSGRLGAGGERDVTRFGAVLQVRSEPSVLTTEASYDPMFWKDAVSGSIWGPGGYGFAVHRAELPAFFCMACDFLLPDSAARWRHVRTLPLHRYGPTKECPCTINGWQTTLTALGSPNNYTIPRGSLVYEMERRAMASADKYFSYDAIIRHIHDLMVDPSTAALKCVPRPATYHPVDT